MQPVTLREITRETVRRIMGLGVKPEQEDNVTSNAVSIAEAYFEPGAWFRAIYAGDEPVGFIMLFDPTLPGATAGSVAMDEVGLWRFMVDGRYQSHGYGRQALDLVCGRLRSRGDVARLCSSYVPGPHGSEAFYLGYGFRKTGQMTHDGTETEILLRLHQED
ncbi:MAG: GNAT family N-acetyltransferase [Alphaproteobacteria bacterium]|nr:GNAT family N-acetyltransferase [Alphaproteobacteria bacterium]